MGYRDDVNPAQEEAQAQMRVLAMEVRHANEEARRRREQTTDHRFVGLYLNECLRQIPNGDGYMRRCRLPRASHPSEDVPAKPAPVVATKAPSRDLLASTALEAALAKSEGRK